MGIIKQGILGGVSGKVGPVIGSSWKGIPYLREIPQSVADPRTKAQLDVRKRFGSVSKLASSMLSTIVQPLNNRFAHGMSGYNLFCKRNKAAFNETTGEFVPENLTISKGKLGSTTINDAETTTDEFIVYWDSNLEGDFQQMSDLAYVAVIDDKGEVIATSSGVENRAQECVNIVLPTLPEGTKLNIYLSFLRSDGTLVSDSTRYVYNVK